MAANDSPPPPYPNYQQPPPSSRYKGVRIRSGKWVSEIREPKKTTRIWLGTYPTPEMAAAAYDVAAIALKGPNTTLNFPESFRSYPTPASNSPSDIRAAALIPSKPAQFGQASGSSTSRPAEDYMDVEDMLDMPNLLVDMAGGMMVSPPRMDNTASYGDSPDNSQGDSLWSYDDK